jgi:hypothetical protein
MRMSTPVSPAMWKDLAPAQRERLLEESIGMKPAAGAPFTQSRDTAWFLLQHMKERRPDLLDDLPYALNWAFLRLDGQGVNMFLDPSWWIRLSAESICLAVAALHGHVERYSSEDPITFCRWLECEKRLEALKWRASEADE